ASLGTEIERGPAGDRTLDRVDRVFAEEDKLGAVLLVTAERGVVDERALRGRIPRHVALPAAVRREIALGQQAPGVRADEEGAVRPVPNECAIVPAALDHRIRDAQGERTVAAGSHAQPDVGLAGETDASWIDDDEAGATPGRPPPPR